MCGRYVITKAIYKTKKIVKAVINVDDNENYNAHPYQNLPVIKKYNNGNTIEGLRWGIVTSWMKKKDYKPLINARLETIDEKITFKKLIKTHRCIAVADGYYEWQRFENGKIPYFFYRQDKKPLFFAGVYDKNEFCLITREASKNVLEIHHRQPVIINQKNINDYLNLELNGHNFLSSYQSPELSFYQISKDVNKPLNNNISLIQKI